MALKNPPSVNRLSQWNRDGRSAFADLISEPISSLATLIVIAMALMLPLVLLTLNIELQKSLANYSGQPQLVIYLDNTSKNSIQNVSERLLLNDSISFVEIVSKTDGLTELAVEQGLESVISALEVNPLPDVLLATPFLNDPASLEQLAMSLAQDEAIDSVQIDSQWLAKLSSISATIGKLGFFIGVIATIAFCLIIFNSIAYLVHRCEEDIRIQKLVGAPDAFIIRPLIFKGLYFGLGGAFIATLFAVGFFQLFNGAVNDYLTSFEAPTSESLRLYLPFTTLLLIHAASGFLGMLVTTFSGYWQLCLREW